MISSGVCRNSAKNATSYNSFPDSCFAEQDGDIINIYNRERLLVELLRHKSKLPFDYYKEILLNYRDIISGLDIRLIQDYIYEVPKSAKIMDTLQLEIL